MELMNSKLWHGQLCTRRRKLSENSQFTMRAFTWTLLINTVNMTPLFLTNIVWELAKLCSQIAYWWWLSSPSRKTCWGVMNWSERKRTHLVQVTWVEFSYTYCIAKKKEPMLDHKISKHEKGKEWSAHQRAPVCKVYLACVTFQAEEEQFARTVTHA